MELRLRVTIATDVGPAREQNEDAVAVDGQVMQHDHGDPLIREVVVTEPFRVVVCDGIGGWQGGRTASLIAAERLSLPSAGQEPEEEFQETSEQLHAIGKQNSKLLRMGTTAVLLEARPDGSASVLHVGDSRAYLADPELARLTHDDRLMPQLPLLLQALGPFTAKLDVHRYDFNLLEGQRVLLCTDGLVDTLDDERIEQLIHDDDAARRLIDQALAEATQDNVTVAVVEVLSSPRDRS